MADSPLRALVVDDTILYRRILTDALEGLGDVHVTGTAPQGQLALARLEQDPVDLVLLDVEMPEMDGLEALKRIRARFPDISVVMVSGSNSLAANATIQALEQGALDFIRKPEGTDPEANRTELREALRPLVRHVRTRRNLRGVPTPPRATAPTPAPRTPAPAPPPPRPKVRPLQGPIEVVGIGISTGGPNALGELVPALPPDLPVPLLLVQHMPPGFTASLAEHLDKRSAIHVKEAQDGETLKPGWLYIAPGGQHMVVRSRTSEEGEKVRFIGLNQNPPEHSCRPSVDVLFRSLATQYEGPVLSVVMTGMGSDGCEGVRTLKRRGCHSLTQSEDSCVIYGMPMAVDEAGLSDEKVHLSRLAARITHLVQMER